LVGTVHNPVREPEGAHVPVVIVTTNGLSCPDEVLQG